MDELDHKKIQELVKSFSASDVFSAIGACIYIRNPDTKLMEAIQAYLELMREQA